MGNVYFDLDTCMKIYSLLGIKKSWFDYSFGNDGEWDEDKFYSDFDKLWNELPAYRKNEIIKKIKL